jgi:hypothetical protein
MASFDDLISRITDDLARADDLTIQIGTAINRAIRHYSSESFWFNEASATMSTVAGQQTYTTAHGLASYIREIHNLRLNNGSGTLSPLYRRSLTWLLDNNISGTTTQGEPTDFVWFDNTLYLYPTPGAVYVTTLYYTVGYADLTTGQSNDFTTEAEDLIEARASWWIHSRVLKDYDAAKIAKAEEIDALENLRARSDRLLITGRLSPSYL